MKPTRLGVFCLVLLVGCAALGGLFGDRVHVGTRAPREAIPDAERALRDAGIAFAAIRAVEPSLEDVFVSVLSDPKGRDA